MEAFLYAIPSGLALSLAAGPVFFVVLETSISKGKAAAFSLDLGAVTADILFILVAFYGSQSFLDTFSNNTLVHIISGVLVASFGIYYFFKSRRGGQLSQKAVTTRKRLFFVKGFLLNFLNVGVLLYWVTTSIAVGGLLEYEPLAMWAFYSTSILIYILVSLLKILFANRFKKKLKGRNLQLIERFISFVLIGFGAFVALRHLL
jgi:threonine/homoserine/homoserine lactone efflux protein